MASPRLTPAMRTIGVVSGGHFLSHMYLLVFPPLFPLLRDDFGLTNTELGLIISVIAFATLLQMPVGQIVDRVGAKYVFLLGVFITSVGVVLAGVASSYLLLLVFALVSGVGQSAFHPADYPLIESVSDPDRKGRNFSVHTFSGYLGFALAPIIVGSLGITFGWRPALLVSGSIGVVYSLFAWLALDTSYQQTTTEPDEPTTDQGVVGVLARPGILVMFGFFLVVVMANRGIQTFAPLFAIDGFGFTESIGNASLTAYFGVTAFTILVGGVLADKYDPRYVIFGTLSVAAVTMWVTVSNTFQMTGPVFIGLFGVMGGAHGLVFASRDRLVSSLSAAGSTGRSFGFVFTGTALGGLISPVVLGAVIDSTTMVVAFVLIGGFFLLAGAIALVANRSFRRLGLSTETN